MSTFTPYRPQGGFSNRGGRNSRYRSHGPNTQHSQLGAPPIMQHIPRAQTVNMGGSRVLLSSVPPTGAQPLLMQPGLAGPNARAPTIFPQNMSVVPQPLPQQLLAAQNPTAAAAAAAAALSAPPFYLHGQPQFPAAATQQPINLGVANAAQIGVPGAPQQISGGMHTLPQMMVSVNTGVGTMTQVPPTSTTAYRGISMTTPRPPMPVSKRQSKAIKIIDPNTHKEVSMTGSKPETQPPAPVEPLSIVAPVPSGPVIFSSAPPTSHVTSVGNNVAQDFKRMVYERNISPLNVPSTVTTASVPKQPRPNAIITDPNNKVGGVSNRIGASDVPSFTPRFEAGAPSQQQRLLLGDQPTLGATQPNKPETNVNQKTRDEFRQKVLQRVNQTSSVVPDEPKVVQEVKNVAQATIVDQNVGENQNESLPVVLPQPPVAATGPPSNTGPDKPETQVEESEKVVPHSEDKAVFESVPSSETASHGAEQEQAKTTPPPASEVQEETSKQPAPIQALPVQPEKPESDETTSKEVPLGDVLPAEPVSSQEKPQPEKVEEVSGASEEVVTSGNGQTDSSGSQATDSEASPSLTEQPTERVAAVEEESETREEEKRVETNQPPTATQVAPEVEPPKAKEEEKPKAEPEIEQKEEEEPVKKVVAVPSSAVLVSEPASVQPKESLPPSAASVDESPGDDVKRTDMSDRIESETKVEEDRPPAAGSQQKPLLSSEAVPKEKLNDTPKEKATGAPKEKVNGEQPKEPSIPKRVQREERPDTVAITKPVKQDKPVDEGKSSSPAKPKEAVKPAEPSVKKPEKPDRSVSTKPVAAVPASAQLTTASSEPPSAPQNLSENPLGLTMYTRDFLLRFKELCTDVPPELKNVSPDIFKMNAHQEHHIPSAGYRDFPRDFSRDRDYPRKGGRSRPESRRGSSYQQPISKEPVDLHKAEHRWVRPTRVDGEDDELFRKFQGILNKLTPQKFQNLAEQALQLKIDDDERLKGCIDKIFTKALEEPKFSIAYANLCKVMSTIKVEVPSEDGKAKVVTFRRVLLTKCQQEFEKDKKDDEEREKMLNAIKETEDAEKKKQLQAELEASEVKNRKRSLGNIRFIGELFKLKMLSETIMHECVVRLLRSSSDEESLECFAGLITTTGKDLDKPEAKTRIDQYFTRIAEIIKKGKIPARIKFMLQDVQELRGNSWVPRLRQEQSLKTIDQIHHEAKVEEEKEKQFVAQAFAGSMKHGGGGRRGSNKPDDWPGGKGDRDRRDKDRERERDRDKPKEKLDARKLQVLSLKHREKKDAGAPVLGPSNFRPQGWGRVGAGASSAVQDSTKTDIKRPSRTSSSGTNKREKDKLPSGRGSGSGPKRTHSTPTPDAQSEKALAIQAVHHVTTRQQQQPAGAAASLKHDQAVQTQPKSRGERKAAQPAQDKLDESTVRRKTVTIVDELVQNKDFKEAIECVREMKSPGKMNYLVSEAINYSLEKSSQHRQYSGQLFSRLVQGRHLSEDKFMEGLNEILEFAEDIAIDIPKIWDYLGEILSPIVSQSTLPLSFLASIYPSLLSSGKAGVLAAKVLVHCRSQLPSDEAVIGLWSSASLEWSTLGVSSDDLGEFLSSHGLAYLQGSSQLSPSSQPLKYLSELTPLFRASDTTNEDIASWIEKNCLPSELQTPSFVTSVTTAIVNATVSDFGSNARFEEDTFLKRAQLIKKYVGKDRELQLSVLYALQRAVTELQHPPGLLNGIFNQIYDLEIVGEEVFRQWKDKGTESFGRGAALATVKLFFDWLDSGETESDDGT